MKLIRWVSVIHLPALITVFLSVFPVNALAQQGRYGDWHMGSGMMGGWGFGGGGGIFMIFIWILVIVGLVFLIKWLIQTITGGNPKTESNPTAMDILKQRYAKGEIDKAEFEAMKKDIIQV